MMAAIIVILCILCMRHYERTTSGVRRGKSPEGFSNNGTPFTLLMNENVYDTFHAGAYDKVYDNPDKIEFECDKILLETGYAQDPQEAVLLDVGCGTGKTLARFRARGVGGLFGVDRSRAMVDFATNTLVQEKKEPSAKCTVACADATRDKMQFPQGTFTHVTCLGGTIYELSDIRAFARLSYAWLQPGGVLSVHVISQPDFSPDLSLGKSQLEDGYRSVNHARHSVDVEGFTYREAHVVRGSKFTKESWFTDKTSGHVRQTEQNLLNYRPEEVVRAIESAGFTFRSRCTYADLGDPFQFLYFFDR